MIGEGILIDIDKMQIGIPKNSTEYSVYDTSRKNGIHLQLIL